MEAILSTVAYLIIGSALLAGVVLRGERRAKITEDD